MMFGGYEYDLSFFPYDDFCDFGDDFYLEDDESFLDHYADEIEDRVIPALDSDEVTAQQFTLFGGAY